MKKWYCFICLLILPLNIFAEEIDVSKLPKLLGSNNMGREFYFSFIPCWESAGSHDLKLYISSTVRTKVVVIVDEKGYEKIKYTRPNDIIEFVLSPAIGQPYRKTDRDKPEPDQVFKGAGVHVVADDPIICYGVTRYQYTSDGFLCIPVPALGKDYIISAFADPSPNTIQWLPAYTNITAAYDKTKVTFTMGGNDWSATAGGMLPDDYKTWPMNAGDVLVIAGLGSHADLSGSQVSATKPVAVVSGNYCAYIPTNCGCCDVIESMELPTNTWGSEYHVTKIFGRLKNSIIKIYAKESKTKVFRDQVNIGFLRYAGGVEGNGHLHMRADEGEPRPIIISGDKPINVTQYNTGQQDDSVVSDPFQMVLVPVEQYQKDITFNTPGTRGGFGFAKNYINLCYESDTTENLPDDLEIAFYNRTDSVFDWYKLKDTLGTTGTPFVISSSGNQYSMTTFKLPGDGVYKLKADKPFAAYAYGFSWCDSYGFPASVALADLTKPDTVPPDPVWLMDCQGNVNTIGNPTEFVTDKPEDAEYRSNLRTIYMHPESYNYKLLEGEFMPCEDQITPWGLECVDDSEDAYARISFSDCAGNDTINNYNL